MHDSAAVDRPRSGDSGARYRQVSLWLDRLDEPLTPRPPLPGDRPSTWPSWGGPLGVARDWFPSVGLDRGRGLAWAGGYVGDGVATTNLAGPTLADLILGRDTELVRLPWVNHRSPPWEPEPLRFIGVNGARRLAASADTVEDRTGGPSRRAELLARLTGH